MIREITGTDPCFLGVTRATIHKDVVILTGTGEDGLEGENEILPPAAGYFRFAEVFV